MFIFVSWKVDESSPRTVVLTTHSMEEAGALSSRMAIQVMGQLRCLGAPMHIKHKYGTGCLANLANLAMATGQDVVLCCLVANGCDRGTFRMTNTSSLTNIFRVVCTCC